MTKEELDAIWRKRNEIVNVLIADNAFCDSIANVIDKLFAEVERLNLEYDAVVAAFSKYAYDSRTWYLCEWCKHKDCFDPKSDENHKPPCDECRREMRENDCAPSWEWRGMQEADDD